MLFKHLLFLVAFSLAAVFFKGQLVHILHGLLAIHDRIANGLGIIFSNDEVGRVLQSVLALLFIPIVLGIVCTMAHWFLKQMHFPHTMTVIWVTWTVLLVTMLSQVVS